MSWFPKPSSPTAAFRDLAAFLRQRSREQVIGAAIALGATGLIVIGFSIDTADAMKPRPQVIEVELYSPKRTDADIIADQKKDQAYKQALDKERQREFQRIGKQFGIE